MTVMAQHVEFELLDRDSPRAAQCLPDGAWHVRTSTSRVVELTPDRREILRTFVLPDDGPWTVGSHLRHAAKADADRVTLVDDRGAVMWQIAHPKWHARLGAHGEASGACAFSQDDSQVWVVAPGETDDSDEWWVLDTASGHVLDRAPLGVATTGSAVLPHPDGRHLGVDLAVPYFGWIGWGGWVDGRAEVVVRESPDGILADIHPDGRCYLTVPGEDGDSVAVRRFPDGTVEASRRAEEIFGDPESFFDTCGGYLGEGRVIVRAFEGPAALLAADTLDVIDVIDYPQDASPTPPTPPPSSPDEMRISGQGTWSTFDHASGRLHVWRV